MAVVLFDIDLSTVFFFHRLNTPGYVRVSPFFPTQCLSRPQVALDSGTQRQFSENICSEDDLRSRIFGTFVVKFLAYEPVLGFSNILKMV